MLNNESFQHDEIEKIVEASKTYLIGMQVNKHWNSPEQENRKVYDITCVAIDRDTNEVQETYFPTKLFNMPLMADAMLRALCVEFALHEVELHEEWSVSVWDMSMEDPCLGMEFVVPHETSIASLNDTFYYIEDNPEQKKPALSLV